MDGGPSVTARRVAAYRLGFSRVPAAYGDPAADEALAADVAAGEQVAANRMHDYLAARTTFFDRTVTGALDRGVRQIVIGAAGYDGRAFRYAKPGVGWFEVDHPATQRDKLSRLGRLGITAPHVRFVEADFTRDPVADRLRAAGLDVGAPSLFLLEGIAVYLEPAALEAVLGQFRQVAGPASRLAISVSLSRGNDEAARARFQAAVAALGEPARSKFTAEEAADLLARTGWQIGADRGEAARRERLHSIGLLTATADVRSPAGPSRSAPTQGSAPAPASAPAQRSAPSAPSVPEPGSLPWPALLSYALVAFTIEFDNEAEHRLPHRTTIHGPSGQGDGPWLVSLAMWENCMRYVTDEPVTVRELETLARTGTNLDGMRRWGYVTIDGTARKIHRGRPGPDAVLRATAAGLRARQIWLPLTGLIEERWRDRLGAGPAGRLRDALVAVVGQLDAGLPDCMPILGATLLCRGPDPALPPRPRSADPAALPLPALLARVLLAFALDYEQEARRSLAVGANLLRVLGAHGTRLRDLPPLTGVSKEAVSWALGILVREHLAVEEADPAAGRGKVARLTAAGADAQRLHHEILETTGRRWQERFTDTAIGALRESLEAAAARQPEPYPDNWRASARQPAVLPHFPMVLHRGGYPDGS